MSEQDNLIRYLSREITFEEWQQLEENANRSAPSIVQHQHQQEVLQDQDENTVTMDLAELSITQPIPSSSRLDKKASSSSVAPVGLIDTNLTVKYLQGEISFEEYSSVLQSEAAAAATADDGVLEDLTDIAGEEEVETEQPVAQKEVKKPKRHVKRSKLTNFQAGLMGEANMQFARGEVNEAIRMCMEVLRQAPNAPEPYQTLAIIYEDQGNEAKAFQFSLIGAHLCPSDVNEWLRVADMALEQNQPDHAVLCYNRAIKADPYNIDLLLASCNLYEKLGQNKKAVEGYRLVLKRLPAGNGDKYLQIARDVAVRSHAAEDLPVAMETMHDAFVKYPAHVTAEDVNLLVELNFHQQAWLSAMAVMIQHCSLVLHYSDGSVCKAVDTSIQDVQLPNAMQPNKLEMSEVLPIDLIAKVAVALIHLKYTSVLKEVVSLVLKENADEVGDLYLDIAEAYMDHGYYREAKPMLATLVKTNNYNLAAVWLRYGECLNSLGELQAAVRAFKQVVGMAPSHLGARISLSGLQQQLGRHQEALDALHQEEIQTPEGPKLDLRLVLPRCLLLYSQKKFQDFIETAKQVIFSNFKEIFHPKFIRVIMGSRSLKHRIGAMRHVLGSDFENTIRCASSILEGTNVTTEDFWDLYVKLCEVLLSEEHYQELQDITIMALMHPQFMSDPQRAQEADFICLTACLLNHNGHFAYNFIREMCVKELYNNRAWNLFSQIINISQEIRHNRFCIRLMVKHPDHYALGILNGHNAMVAGTYKHALGEYVAAFRQQPHDPLNSLCIGLVFTHMACQKFAAKRHALTVQACAFLNQYLELRGECQESYYNLGRAMHQIGLYHAAVYYYEKVLSLPPAITGPDQDDYDLSRETAFNLSLIYKSSGSHELATRIIQQYLVI